MGCNLHGNLNEKLIVEMLNNKKISDLNDVLFNFIKFICIKESLVITNSTLIKAKKLNEKYKSDIVILINSKKFFVSIKMGKGNSIHQENLKFFLNYCKKANLIISESQIKDFYFFINNDEKSKDILKKNVSLMLNLNAFFEENKEKLITYFLKTGNYDMYSVDYIFYGTPFNASWAKMDELCEYLNNHKSMSKNNIHLSVFVIQAWNRKYLTKRGSIQIKWNSIEKDINKFNSFY